MMDYLHLVSHQHKILLYEFSPFHFFKAIYFILYFIYASTSFQNDIMQLTKVPMIE